MHVFERALRWDRRGTEAQDRLWRIASYRAYVLTYRGAMTSAIVTQEDLHRRLAVNVRAARKAVGLTLKGASAQAEMHWRHWQKVEAAEVNVTLQTLSRMGAVLGIDPSALIGAPKAPGKRR